MKNKLIGIGSYFFGGIAVLFAGMILGTNINVHTTWQASDSYHIVMFVSSFIALRLYWIHDSAPMANVTSSENIKEKKGS